MTPVDPNLKGGTDTVLAVNSYVTNVNCSGVGYSQRVDIPEVLEWINTSCPKSDERAGGCFALPLAGL